MRYWILKQYPPTLFPSVNFWQLVQNFVKQVLELELGGFFSCCQDRKKPSCVLLQQYWRLYVAFVWGKGTV